VVICLERGADLHIAQLMPPPLTVSCFSKIQIGFTFLVPAHPGNPGQRAVKRARVCVCVCLCLFVCFIAYVHAHEISILNFGPNVTVTAVSLKKFEFLASATARCGAVNI